MYFCIIKKYNVLFIGYPTISPQEKLKAIRQFCGDSFDWTNKTNDQVLLERLHKFIDISQKIKESCAKYNLPFFDTSDNFEQVIEEAHAFLTTEP